MVVCGTEDDIHIYISSSSSMAFCVRKIKGLYVGLFANVAETYAGSLIYTLNSFYSKMCYAISYVKCVVPSHLSSAKIASLFSTSLFVYIVYLYLGLRTHCDLYIIIYTI